MTKLRTARTPRPSRRKLDYEAAFAYWDNAGGQRRSFREVADQFGVAVATVYAAAEREGWNERAWEIQERARREADRRSVKSAAERIQQTLQLVDATKVTYARGLQSGRVVVSASEMAAIMRVEAALIGAPTERIAGEGDGYRRSLEEIEAELAELPAEQVDAILVADAVVAKRVAELPAGEPADPQPDPPAIEPAEVAELVVDAVPVEELDAEALAAARAADERAAFARLEQDVLTGKRGGRW
jgi:transposase